jgi:tetratricopeptide (TPR) repeat protein
MRSTISGANLLLCTATALLPWLAASSEPYFDQGVKLYGKGDYKGAQPYFTQAVKTSPDNGQAYYYEALCRQQLGDIEGAKTLYKKVYVNFSGSP